MTTFGSTKSADNDSVPILDGSTAGVKFDIVATDKLNATAVAQFGQDRLVRSGAAIAVQQFGQRTLIWAVKYQLNVGNEPGTFRKIGVSKIRSSDGIDVGAVIGFFVDVLEP